MKLKILSIALSITLTACTAQQANNEAVTVKNMAVVSAKKH